MRMHNVKKIAGIESPAVRVFDNSLGMSHGSAHILKYTYMYTHVRTYVPLMAYMLHTSIRLKKHTHTVHHKITDIPIVWVWHFEHLVSDPNIKQTLMKCIL